MSDKPKFKLMDWAKDHAPKAISKVLDVAGDLTGVKALNVLSKVIHIENPDNLSSIEIQEAREIEASDFKQLELFLQDRANARSREVELAKAGKMDWMMKAVGLVVLTLLCFTVVSIFFFELKNENMAHLVLGEILGLSTGLVAYYFGSSKGSSDKTKLLTTAKDSGG